MRTVFEFDTRLHQAPWLSLAFFALGLCGFAAVPHPTCAEEWVQTSGARSELIPTDVTLLPPLQSPSEDWSPESFTLDGLGQLFVLDREENTILRLDVEGGWETFSAGGQGGQRLAIIVGLASLGPDLFALDPLDVALFQFDLEGRLRTEFSLLPSLESHGLDSVDAVDFTVTKAGELLLLDRGGRRLLFFDRFGAFLTDLAEGTSGKDRFRSPVSIAQDGSGEVYVLDPATRRVHRFSRQGQSRPSFPYEEDLPKGSARGRHIAATNWGQVLVASSDGSWIRIFDSEGTFLFQADFPERAGVSVTDLAVSSDSLIFLAEPDAGEISCFRLHYPPVPSSGP